MSELGLGTLQAGDRSFFRNTDPNEYRKVLRAALKRGISHFDTAYTYREAETLLGALIKESKRDRETIYITDKIMPVPTLERKAETALKRLGTEYIDTLLIHWPTGDEKLVYDSLKILERLQERELVRRFGISNFPYDLLDKLSLDFEIRAYERPVSLLWTKDLFKDLELCKRRGIGLLGYSPLGMGVLLGKRDFDDERRSLPCLTSQRLSPLCEEIERIAAKRGTTKANICLSWALSTEAEVVFAGASRIEQIPSRDDVIELDAEEKLSLELKANELSSSLPYDNLYGHQWKDM